jgi:hypothetical protein
VRWRRSWRSADACVGTTTTELVKAREHIRVSQRVAWPTTPLNGPRRRGRPRARALVRARSTDRSICTTTDPRLRRPTTGLRGRRRAKRGGNPTAKLLGAPLEPQVRSPFATHGVDTAPARTSRRQRSTRMHPTHSPAFVPSAPQHTPDTRRLHQVNGG